MVTLHEKFMQSLPASEMAGYHKIGVAFEKDDDDYESVVFVNVVEKIVAAAALPSTGDDRNMTPWAVLLMLSAVSMMIMARKKRAA